MFLSFVPASAQQGDSTLALDTVIIRSFERNEMMGAATRSRVITLNTAGRDQKTSFVQSFNSVAGVRMEERSPGSYRINIRGSSLRSPFGVRNVKVYWNGLPLTDAGGNTYFNQLSHNQFSWLEINKGPASSMYGAGTGGAVFIHNFSGWQKGADLDYTAGSFGLHNVSGSVNFGKKENRNRITFSHLQSRGYRVQSASRRTNASLQSQIVSGKKQQMHLSVLFNDMHYETPGALTLTEFKINPRAARPAAGGFPSAEQARAAIYQTNLLVGVTNYFSLDRHWKNAFSAWAMYNQVKNPAIRNYERRKEPGWGARTVFTYEKPSGRDHTALIHLAYGAEVNLGYYNILVSNNLNGAPDTMQTNDDARFSNYLLFAQGRYRTANNWSVTAGISSNHHRAGLTRLNAYPVSSYERKFRNEITPRLELQKKWNEGQLLGFVLSKGFSPPTLQEILPSNTVINETLEAEKGWNYEFLAATSFFANRLTLNLEAFSFRLSDAIVQRRDSSGADYFVNAGHTSQKGIEISTKFVKTFGGQVKLLRVDIAWTFQHFRYGSFARNSDDYSGKIIPSVPANTISALLDIHTRAGIYLESNFYFASRIPLNDANTAWADPYHLLHLQAGWQSSAGKPVRLKIFAGIENLLNKTYSAGNDINAPAGRFFNAAPARSFYMGMEFRLRTKTGE